MRSPDHEELSAAGRLWDLALHMVLPVFCYSLGDIAYYTRFLRASLVSVMGLGLRADRSREGDSRTTPCSCGTASGTASCRS